MKTTVHTPWLRLYWMWGLAVNWTQYRSYFGQILPHGPIIGNRFRRLSLIGHIRPVQVRYFH